MFELKTSENALENELFKSVFDKTPDYIKNLNLMNFDIENLIMRLLTLKGLTLKSGLQITQKRLKFQLQALEVRKIFYFRRIQDFLLI